MSHSGQAINQMFLTGCVDVMHTAPEEEQEFVQSFLMRIRRDPRYKDSLFIAMIEAQMGTLSAANIAAHMRKVPGPLYPMVNYTRADDDEAIGVPSRSQEKQMYVLDAWCRLQRNSICFESVVHSSDSARALAELRSQLESYVIVEKKAANSMQQIWSARKFAATGKLMGGLDDIVSSFLILCHHEINAEMDERVADWMPDFPLNWFTVAASRLAPPSLEPPHASVSIAYYADLYHQQQRASLSSGYTALPLAIPTDDTVHHSSHAAPAAAAALPAHSEARAVDTHWLPSPGTFVSRPAEPLASADSRPVPMDTVHAQTTASLAVSTTSSIGWSLDIVDPAQAIAARKAMAPEPELNPSASGDGDGDVVML